MASVYSIIVFGEKFCVLFDGTLGAKTREKNSKYKYVTIKLFLFTYYTLYSKRCLIVPVQDQPVCWSLPVWGEGVNALLILSRSTKNVLVDGLLQYRNLSSPARQLLLIQRKNLFKLSKQ